MNQLTIYSDSPAFDTMGYDNCNMQTNGEELVMKKLVNNTMCVFDVGANVGEWTGKVLHAYPDVQLYAFEPIPDIFNVLQSSVASSNCNFYNIAFSNMQGIQEFKYYVGRSMLSGLFERPCVTAHEIPKTIDVVTDTLDNFCDKHAIASIDFLKIDTEGAEMAILHGAARLLRDHRIQYIQFEYGGTYRDAQTTLQEAYRLLTLCKYDMYRIVNGGLIHITRWRDALENYRYSNYLAVARK
jgi:FkbM family methyltransferase